MDKGMHFVKDGKWCRLPLFDPRILLRQARLAQNLKNLSSNIPLPTRPTVRQRQRQVYSHHPTQSPTYLATS